MEIVVTRRVLFFLWLSHFSVIVSLVEDFSVLRRIKRQAYIILLFTWVLGDFLFVFVWEKSESDMAERLLLPVVEKVFNKKG